MQAYIKGTVGPKIEMVQTVRRVRFKRGKTPSGVDYVRRLDGPAEYFSYFDRDGDVFFQMKKRHRDRLQLVNEDQGEWRNICIHVINRI